MNVDESGQKWMKWMKMDENLCEVQSCGHFPYGGVGVGWGAGGFGRYGKCPQLCDFSYVDGLP